MDVLDFPIHDRKTVIAVTVAFGMLPNPRSHVRISTSPAHRLIVANNGTTVKQFAMNNKATLLLREHFGAAHADRLTRVEADGHVEQFNQYIPPFAGPLTQLEVDDPDRERRRVREIGRALTSLIDPHIRLRRPLRRLSRPGLTA